MVSFLVLVGTLVAINGIAVLGLNLQLGYAGMVNLMAITCIALGGYTAMVLMLPPPGQGVGHYMLGLGLPFPLAALGAMAVAGVFGLAAGAVALRRMRAHYFAIVTFCIAEMAHQFVINYTGLFNGASGLYGLAPPFGTYFSASGYPYFYLALSLVVFAAVFLFVEYLRKRPFGRALRAAREDRDAAMAFGRNVYTLQLKAFVIGAVLAGLSGALLVGFVGALDPNGWTSAESLILLTALFIGGSGNNIGVTLGTLVVAGLVGQGVTFIPAGLLPVEQQASIQVMVYGIALMLILRFRPAGLLPERPGRDNSVPAEVAD
jgi:ABC-type branched-subunit amino acid transport system permease subunit